MLICFIDSNEVFLLCEESYSMCPRRIGGDSFTDNSCSSELGFACLHIHKFTYLLLPQCVEQAVSNRHR